MDSLTLKRHKKAAHAFALLPLLFKLQQKGSNSVISARVGARQKVTRKQIFQIWKMKVLRTSCSVGTISVNICHSFTC